jgi:hypothetical protein
MKQERLLGKAKMRLNGGPRVKGVLKPSPSNGEGQLGNFWRAILFLLPLLLLFSPYVVVHLYLEILIKH